MNARVLIADDDAVVRDVVRRYLERDGLEVRMAGDGNEALRVLGTERIDVAVLDVMMPGPNGLSLCRTLRQGGDYTVPVILLTALSEEDDRIAGLEAGADDYLTKPFDLPELQARLRALIRRASGSPTPTLSHAGVVLEPASKRVTQNGQAVTLSAREYALLHDLLLNKNHIRTRSQLEESLYAWGEEAGSNTVEVYIHHLRRKFGADFIRTIRGLGYQLGDLT